MKHIMKTRPKPTKSRSFIVDNANSGALAGADYASLWVRFVMFGRASDVLTRTAVRAASVRSGKPCAPFYAETL